MKTMHSFSSEEIEFSRKSNFNRKKISILISIGALFLPIFIYLLYFFEIIQKNYLVIASILSLTISFFSFLYSYLIYEPFDPEYFRIPSDDISSIRALIFKLERALINIDTIEAESVNSDQKEILKKQIIKTFDSLSYNWLLRDLEIENPKELMVFNQWFLVVRNNIKQILSFLHQKIELIQTENNTAVQEGQKNRENTSLIGNRVNSRISSEINALSKRANAYIFIGSVIAISGGVYLYFASQDAIDVLKKANFKTTEISDFAYNELPLFLLRLSVALFVEFFAYYFLRLHKDAMENIKFYQNELTNIDMKTIALNAAYAASGDGNNLGIVIKDLSSTERNFILEGKQTTIEIEKQKSNKALFVETLDKATSLFKKKD